MNSSLSRSFIFIYDTLKFDILFHLSDGVNCTVKRVTYSAYTTLNTQVYTGTIKCV